MAATERNTQIFNSRRIAGSNSDWAKRRLRENVKHFDRRYLNWKWLGSFVPHRSKRYVNFNIILLRASTEEVHFVSTIKKQHGKCKERKRNGIFQIVELIYLRRVFVWSTAMYDLFFFYYLRFEFCSITVIVQCVCFSFCIWPKWKLNSPGRSRQTHTRTHTHTLHSETTSKRINPTGCLMCVHQKRENNWIGDWKL